MKSIRDEIDIPTSHFNRQNFEIFCKMTKKVWDQARDIIGYNNSILKSELQLAVSIHFRKTFPLKTIPMVVQKYVIDYERF
jgi:hypothetical protein